MSKLGLAATALVSAAAATALHVRNADACSGCFGAHFVPEDGATVPANVPALYWRPSQNTAPSDPALVTLARADAPDVPLPITRTLAPNQFDYLLVPDAPLEPGVTYVLRDPQHCETFGGPAVKRSTFTAGPAAPLPASLGTLGVVGNDQTRTSVAAGASCSTLAHLARSVVAIDFTAEAAPWRGALFFETLVDGNPWHPSAHLLQPPGPGASWLGRGIDALYAVCASELGAPSTQLPEGPHEVLIRATLPGTTLALATTPARTTLTCRELPADCEPTCDCDAPPCDPVEPPVEPDGGCCGAAPAPAGPLALTALAALALLRRRRRPAARA